MNNNNEFIKLTKNNILMLRSDPLKAEKERKDLLIMRLKAELFEAKHKDRDYKLLHEAFVHVAHKRDTLQKEKVGHRSS